MDISIAKQKKPKYTRFLAWGLGLLIISAASYYLWFLAQANYSVNASEIVTGSVKQGEFSVTVRGSGILVPRNIQWLSSNVEARVEKVIVKAGKSVKKGDLIVKKNQFIDKNSYQKLYSYHKELGSYISKSNYALLIFGNNHAIAIK